MRKFYQRELPKLIRKKSPKLKLYLIFTPLNFIKCSCANSVKPEKINKICNLRKLARAYYLLSCSCFAEL